MKAVLAALTLALALASPAAAQLGRGGHIPKPGGPVTTQNCTTTNAIPRLSTATSTNAVLDCTPMTSDGINVTLASGQFLPGSDNAQDVGSGALSWRSGYFDTSLVMASLSTIGASGGGRFIFRVASDNAYAIASDLTGAEFSATSGAMRHLEMQSSFTPASGSGSYAMIHANPTINGTSSGTAYGLVVASKTNVLTGGTIKLMSLGTTTTDAFTGYSEVFSVNTAGTVVSSGSIQSTTGNVVAAGGMLPGGGSRGGLQYSLDGVARLTNDADTGFTRLVLGTNNTSGVGLVKTGAALQVALGDGTLGGSLMGIPVATQTIAAGNTVTADACGTIKRISAGSAVTTDTTNTFTAPAAANAGCTMYVVNVGSFNITLDANALFNSPGAADVVMTPNDAILVGSSGASGAWYALSALVAN